MRLHETPIQDLGLGVQKIHAQLKNLCLEMQSLKQDRTTHPEVWCIKCKGLFGDRRTDVIETTGTSRAEHYRCVMVCNLSDRRKTHYE